MLIKNDIVINNMIYCKSQNTLYNNYILDSEITIIDKINQLSGGKPIVMSSLMFIQLYLQLEKNPNTNKFIFHFNDLTPQIYYIYNHYIDNDTNRILTIYPSTFEIIKNMYEIQCPSYYVDIVQIDIDKFIGLTENGYKILTLSKWIEYIYNNSISFVNNKIIVTELKIEKYKKINENHSINEFLQFTKTQEFNFYLDEQNRLDKLKNIKSYIDLGFFNLLTIRNKDTYIMNIGKQFDKTIKKIIY